MNALDQATATQLANIEKKAAKPLAELVAQLRASGLTRHSELRSFAMQECGLGYGDANALVHHALQSDGTAAAREANLSEEEVLDGIYTGARAALRPIHTRLLGEIREFGEFETVPRKGYVSLRRKKQFAMLGPATNSRVEVGLNMKGVPGTERLLEQPAGGMCQYKVRVTSPEEVDAELIGWVRQAFDAAA